MCYYSSNFSIYKWILFILSNKSYNKEKDMSDESPKAAKCACFIKIMNFVTGFMLIGFGIAGIVFVAINALLSFQFFLFFSPIFMIMFGLIVLSVELNIKFMLQYFSFLHGLMGRGVFNIYLSSSVYYYFSCQNGDDVLAWVFGTLVFAVGVAYMIVHCCGGSDGSSQTKEQMM